MEQERSCVKECIKGVLEILFSLRKRLAINLILTCLIFFLEILAISSQGWQANSTTNYGLWSKCVTYEKVTCRTTLDTSDGCMNTTRAFLFMSILSECATLLFMAAIAKQTHRNKSSKVWNICVLITLISSTFCLFIAVMVYGICNNNAIDDASLDWSFGICVSAMFLSVFHTAGYLYCGCDEMGIITLSMSELQFIYISMTTKDWLMTLSPAIPKYAYTTVAFLVTQLPHQILCFLWNHCLKSNIKQLNLSHGSSMEIFIKLWPVAGLLLRESLS